MDERKFPSRQIDFAPHGEENLRYVRRIETKLVEDFTFEYNGVPLTTASRIAVVLERLAEKDREHGIVLYLDYHDMPIGYDLYLGGVDFVAIDPRRVITLAGQLLASKVVFAHNHPQGDPHPSGADEMLCLQMSQFSRIMGWDLVDFMVIGRQGFYSFKDMNHPALTPQAAPQVIIRVGSIVKP